MSRYCVTGAAGFVGRNLVKRLTENGHEVTAMVRKASDAARVGVTSARIVVADLLDPSSLRLALVDSDVVCHCAVSLPGPHNRGDVWETNVNGTRNLVSACGDAQVRRLIFISTESVYRPRLDYAASETSPLTSERQHVHEGGYPSSKVEAESIAFEGGRKHGFEVVVVRPSLIYGPEPSVGFNQILLWSRRRVHWLIGGGTCPISICHIADVVAAIAKAGEQSRAAGQVYNVSDGEQRTKREILELIAKASGTRPLCVPIPARPAYLLTKLVHFLLKPVASGLAAKFDVRKIDFSISNHAMDIRKIRTELGYSPTISLTSGLLEIFPTGPDAR